MISFTEWFKSRDAQQSFAGVEKEGSMAYRQGKPYEANPYDPVRDRDNHAAWNNGWQTAASFAVYGNRQAQLGGQV